MDRIEAVKAYLKEKASKLDIVSLRVVKFDLSGGQ